MGNPVVWFEIHGQDADRLHGFYRTVFGWSIDADNPMSYGFVETGSESGIQGAIATGQGTRGVVIFLETDDVQGALDRAVAAGAEVVVPVGGIPGVVQLAQFRDPEGNRIGLVKDLRDPMDSERDWMGRVRTFGKEES
jgi:predicted enzyme related to lactoylglutathione lyase